ncbi:MarR family winged helix-turn-helix transcriptional regulator [Streptomyces sp. NPDC056002]|uniref:MarR family winged helix-turn-helix transcriptional regulator n=1 Tax=Streptomyces sp. NPDC056002 TaxID=3345675 RepID=UPI0035DED6EA
MAGQSSGRLGPGGGSADEEELDQEAESVTQAVMAASRLLVAISARALASTDDSLTLPQLRTLVVLERCGPVKLAVMAATLGVNPSTAMRMVDRLEGVGLVVRKPNPSNRREVVLSLTRGGRSLVTRVLDNRRSEIRTLVQRLPVDSRVALVPALSALAEAADEMGVDSADESQRVGGLVDDPLNPAPPDPPMGGRRQARPAAS